jgi:GNAT superfamily N-acetyltransferase
MAAEFTLRVTIPDDADAISALLEASYTAAFAGHYENHVLAAALPLMTRANPRLLASGTYHVAETGDGVPIGCGGWTIDRPGTAEVVPGLAHVRHFGTHPDWARCGVGRALFGRCADEAKARGIGRLECYSSLVAENFYRALGFTVVERKDIELRAGITLAGVVMAFDLG